MAAYGVSTVSKLGAAMNGDIEQITKIVCDDRDIHVNQMAEEHFGFHFPENSFLGKGSGGSVYRVIRTSDGLNAACKTIDLDDLSLEDNSEDNLNDFKNEILIMSLLQGHQNIIQLYDHGIINYRHIFIFMELADQPLSNLVVSKTQKPLPEALLKNYFIQIMEGLRHAFTKGIAHMDLKPDNILIIGDVLKIADFGLSAVAFCKEIGPRLGEGYHGNPLHYSPEIISSGLSIEATGQGEEYDFFPAEIWSLAITIIALAQSNHPFNQASAQGRRLVDMKERRYDLNGLKTNYSRNLSDLIEHMLNPDPRARITIRGIFTHAWLADIYGRCQVASSHTPAKRPYKLFRLFRLPSVTIRSSQGNTEMLDDDPSAIPMKPLGHSR